MDIAHSGRALKILGQVVGPCLRAPPKKRTIPGNRHFSPEFTETVSVNSGKTAIPGDRPFFLVVSAGMVPPPGRGF